MTFVSYAAVGGYGIATVAAGTIASACKIFDGVVDPFLAFFGDRFVTKYGRVRILLSSGFFFMALGTLILFFWGIGTNVVVYVLANLLYILGRSIFQVGGDTGNVISTKDPKQRAAMGRWGVIFSTCSTAVLSVYNSMLLLPKYGKLDMPALQELTIVVLSANAAMTLCSVLAIAEKDRPENLKLGVGKVDLKACWSLLKGNVPLRCFVVSMASDQLANQIASQSAISIMVFGIVMGNYSLRGKLSMFELVPTILFVFFASRFAGKRGMKKGLVFWTKICMLISVVMVAYMALIDTAQISSNTLLWIIFIVIDILFAASRSAVSACTNAIRPDITD